MLLPESRSVISGPPDGQCRTALGRNARQCRLSVTALWQARSWPVPQLRDAVRRTHENRLGPVYPPLSDAPDEHRGVIFSHPTGSAAGSASRHVILLSAWLVHFISPAGEGGVTCGPESRCYAAGES
jgi:hypothetical protein